MSAPIVKYQNIVVPVPFPNPPGLIYIPDQPNLRSEGVRIVGIEVQDIVVLPIVSDMITQNVPLNTFRNTFLTLVVGDVNNITRMPLQNFQTIMDGSNAAPTGRANLWPRDFANVNIYWNKSYLEIPAAVLPVAACAFNIGVYYYPPANPANRS